MAAQSSGPVFPVHVDEQELAEDLDHATGVGRAAIGSMIEELKADGVPTAWLARTSFYGDGVEAG